jgi:hypothetical protein
MGPKLAVFTVTGGRTGTHWLSKLFRDNLENAEVHHELLGPGKFGYATPGLAELCDFNQLGVTKLVQEFWARKFAMVELTEADVYVETSHQLCKAGLLEHLYLCPCPVLIIVLQRDALKTISSYMKVGYRTNIDMWLWFLDPNYRGNIVRPQEYRIDKTALSFWYHHEMTARQAFYTTTSSYWLRSSDRLVTSSLEQLSEDPSTLWTDSRLFPYVKPKVTIPEQCNVTPTDPSLEQYVQKQQSLFADLSKIAALGTNYPLESWCSQHNLGVVQM